MFDLIVSGYRKPGRRGVAPWVLSSAVHVLAIGMIALSVLFATDQLPAAPAEIVTFVSVAPPPPPPPPPPAPAVATAATSRPASTPRPNSRRSEVVSTRTRPAPVEAPASLEGPADVGAHFGGLDGVPGGIVGGVPGGVIGGVVGGLAEALPPAPPPPPAPRVPVRVGGDIRAPALLKRVPPVYPSIAAKAGIEGVVILEATVSPDGRVEDVRVLRSAGLLNSAAVDAVRQWEYAPLLLNGQPAQFILTVTVNFSLP
jgi:periplasmic protein TonB